MHERNDPVGSAMETNPSHAYPHATDFTPFGHEKVSSWGKSMEFHRGKKITYHTWPLFWVSSSIALIQGYRTRRKLLNFKAFVLLVFNALLILVQLKY